MAEAAKKKTETKRETRSDAKGASDVKRSTLRLVSRLAELPEKTRDEAERRARELLERLLETKAGETLEQVPERALAELDELLDRVGLMRKSKHEEELAKAKKRAKAAGKRAAKKELERADNGEA